MVVKQLAAVLGIAIACSFATPAFAQSPHVLNNFEDGTLEGWAISSGNLSDIGVFYNEDIDAHELTFVAHGNGAVRDNFNNSGALFQNTAGGVDLTGLSTIEMDIRYEGDLPSHNLQFLCQTSPASTYVGMSDVTLQAGVPQTISFNLGALTPPQIAYVRTWGVSIRAFPGGYEGGPLTYYIKEVRSTGTPLSERVYCHFRPDGPDNGMHGIFMNFNGAAIVGNTGQNQTGFTRVDYPGTDGVLEWQQQYAENDEGVPFGPAWSWQNGFDAGFNGRPTDASNYRFIEVDIMLENENDEPLDVTYFTQCTIYFEDTNIILNSFQYHNHDTHVLTANSGFQTLLFAIDDSDPELVNMAHVMRHGLVFSAAEQGEIYTLRVDEIRALADIVPPPDLADGFAIY